MRTEAWPLYGRDPSACIGTVVGDDGPPCVRGKRGESWTWRAAVSTAASSRVLERRGIARFDLVRDEGGDGR